jgi:hypothetical protein
MSAEPPPDSGPAPPSPQPDPEQAPETPSPPAAWQPLTPLGVARFAQAGLGRVLLVELIMAVIVSIAMVWLLRRAWAPAIAQAAHSMPNGAKIQNGRLSGVPDPIVSQTKFLAIAAAPSEQSELGQSADFQVQLRPANFRVNSVFEPNWGLEFDYDHWNYDLSPASLEPLWGAWRPVVLALCGIAIGLSFGSLWTFLAFLYAGPARLAAWFADRQLTLSGAWKISAMSQMSGGALTALALGLYGLQAVDLIGLGCFLAGQFVLDWIFLAAAIHALPSALAPPPKNPFFNPA